MLPNDSVLYSMVQGLKIEDPVLKDLFRKVITQIQILNAEVFESSSVTSLTPVTGVTSVVAAPTNFTYTLIPAGIKFEWTSPDSSAVFFEIRRGASWTLGSRQLITLTTSAILEGQLVGSYTYWIKSQSIDGVYSEDANSVIVVVPPIGTTSISGSVIDNFVLLYWTIPTSAFRIDYYIITKGGVEIGRQTGTFIPVFENAGGTYTYGVQAVDIFGNVSTLVTKDFQVSQPPDYVLEALESSSLLGTRTNVIRDATLPSIYANINEAETWSAYAANSYVTFQDEIDAGYPYYLQPTLATGQYLETIDYGAVFDGVIVTIDWNYNEIVPSMAVATFLSTSVDNVTFTAESSGVTVYAASLRYVKIRITFTALN